MKMRCGQNRPPLHRFSQSNQYHHVVSHLCDNTGHQPMNKDPGLQPERTAMSWLRTQLVLFALGLLFFKVTEQYAFPRLSLIGILMMFSAILGTVYCRFRFTQVFENMMTVTRTEYWVKRYLSSLITLMTVGYLIYMWTPNSN